MKVVLDTNVLISAILWKGELTSFYNFINERKITLCFSKTTIDELIKVSHYSNIATKIKEENIDFEQIIKVLISNSIIVQPKKIPSIIKKDPTDNEFLACAECCQAFFIVSGDKHFLNIKEFQGISIVSPKQFLEIINNK